MTQFVITTRFINISVSVGAGLQDGIPTITATSGNTDPYTHTIGGTAYPQDVNGNTLTVAFIEANSPVCIKRPTVTGDATAGGNTLTIAPAIWLYTGDYPGDPVFQQQLDGVNISGGTGLTYVTGLAAGQKNFTVEETFGGVTVESTQTLLDYPDASIADPNGHGAKLVHWFDLTDASRIFTSTAQSTQVSSNGDAVRSINDKKAGSSQIIDDDFGGLSIWDADNQQCRIVLAAERRFDFRNIASGFTTGMEIYIGFKSTKERNGLFLKYSSGPRVFNYTTGGDPGTPLAQNIGTPVHTANGEPVVGNRRVHGYQAWATGKGVVMGAHGIDMTAFEGTPAGSFWIFNEVSQYTFDAFITHVVITTALTATERAALIDWLMARVPV